MAAAQRVREISEHIAHASEQLQYGRLIRPRGEYTGPRDRTVVPLAQR